MTHESVFVGDVVGEFEFVERDWFAHPLFAGRRGVGMDIHALWHLRVGLASNHPTRVVELVAAVVDGHNVHQHDVLGSFVQSRHFNFERRKHSPTSGARVATVFMDITNNNATYGYFTKIDRFLKVKLT